MNGLAFLGLFLIVYAGVLFFGALKKPAILWDNFKVRGFRKLLGEKGTEIFFYVCGFASGAIGIWLLTK